jgi:hypothetical protein
MKHGGWVLILLSVVMLLVGGGVGPPVIGILAGVAGLGIHARYTWSRQHLPVTARAALAQWWPWVFMVYVFGLNAPDLFVDSFFFATVSLLVTIVLGVAYDIQRQAQGNQYAVA